MNRPTLPVTPRVSPSALTNKESGPTTPKVGYLALFVQSRETSCVADVSPSFPPEWQSVRSCSFTEAGAGFYAWNNCVRTQSFCPAHETFGKKGTALVSVDRQY